MTPLVAVLAWVALSLALCAVGEAVARRWERRRKIARRLAAIRRESRTR